MQNENERIKNKVKDMLKTIIDEVDPNNVLDLLIERRIVNIECREKIMNEKTKKERCRALIYPLLNCAHKEAFIVFRQAFEEHYPWIVERIDENKDDFSSKDLDETKVKVIEEANEKTEQRDEVASAESSRLLKSCVFIIGFYDPNENNPTSDVIKINLNKSADIISIQQIPAKMGMESAAAVYDKSVFVTGIGNQSNEIWRFDSTTSNWMQCASMVQCRRRHGVAFLGHILYICGGWIVSQNRTLDDVEAYDALGNRCVHVGRLAWAVESSGNCVPFKSSLYIFGGNGPNGKPLGKVQVFDTKLNTCSVLNKDVPIGDSFLRAALWENTVILLGVYGNCIYNFEAKDFEVRKEFKTDAVYCGLAISDGFVFVIGGGRVENNKWICRDDVRYFSIENILNNQPINWKTCFESKLPKPTLVYAFADMFLEP